MSNSHLLYFGLLLSALFTPSYKARTRFEENEVSRFWSPLLMIIQNVFVCH